ncbi:hypothetical protein HanIR_Chr11g0559421 [Helianthus annuus]|nr:hypothetical protein HanIR_Chr11g0559421 [Helianthus annuus]
MDISDDFVDIYEEDQPAKKLGFDAMTPKKNQICSPMKDSPKTDSGSVEIISYGQYFSPFKSEMHREVIEQVVFFLIKFSLHKCIMIVSHLYVFLKCIILMFLVLVVSEHRKAS